jgi:hypothetical protein
MENDAKISLSMENNSGTSISLIEFIFMIVGKSILKIAPGNAYVTSKIEGSRVMNILLL